MPRHKHVHHHPHGRQVPHHGTHHAAHAGNQMGGAFMMPMGPVGSPLVDPDDDFAGEEGDFPVFAGAVIAGRYRVQKLLGSGTFGKVVECLDTHARRPVAIKISKLTEDSQEEMMNELEVLEELRNADPEDRFATCSLLEWFEFSNQIHAVFPKYGQSLHHFLKNASFRPLRMNTIRCMGQQLFRALAFLHSLQFVHSDIKPENVLLVDGTFSDPRVPATPRVVLIDFGSATHDHEEKDEEIGTAHYQSPEMLLHLDWSFAIDIWSMALVLLELYTGKTLFKADTSIEQLAMMQCALGNVPAYMSVMAGVAPMETAQIVSAGPKLEQLIAPKDGDFCDFLRHALSLDPRTRLTAQQALDHPFLRTPVTDPNSATSVPAGTPARAAGQHRKSLIPGRASIIGGGSAPGSATGQGPIAKARSNPDLSPKPTYRHGSQPLHQPAPQELKRHSSRDDSDSGSLQGGFLPHGRSTGAPSLVPVTAASGTSRPALEVSKPRSSYTAERVSERHDPRTHAHHHSDDDYHPGHDRHAAGRVTDAHPLPARRSAQHRSTGPPRLYDQYGMRSDNTGGDDDVQDPSFVHLVDSGAPAARAESPPVVTDHIRRESSGDNYAEVRIPTVAAVDSLPAKTTAGNKTSPFQRLASQRVSANLIKAATSATVSPEYPRDRARPRARRKSSEASILAGVSSPRLSRRQRRASSTLRDPPSSPNTIARDTSFQSSGGNKRESRGSATVERVHRSSGDRVSASTDRHGRSTAAPLANATAGWQRSLQEPDMTRWSARLSRQNENQRRESAAMSQTRDDAGGSSSGAAGGSGGLFRRRLDETAHEAYGASQTSPSRNSGGTLSHSRKIDWERLGGDRRAPSYAIPHRSPDRSSGRDGGRVTEQQHPVRQSAPRRSSPPPRVQHNSSEYMEISREPIRTSLGQAGGASGYDRPDAYGVSSPSHLAMGPRGNRDDRLPSPLNGVDSVTRFSDDATDESRGASPLTVPNASRYGHDNNAALRGVGDSDLGATSGGYRRSNPSPVHIPERKYRYDPHAHASPATSGGNHGDDRRNSPYRLGPKVSASRFVMD